MLKEKVQEIIDEVYERYKLSYKSIVKDYHQERTSANDYDGRQLFELLQNADDQMIDTKDGKVFISFFDNILTVANTGEPFSEKGFDSIINANLSSKTNSTRSIGYKGLGFRSILNWANEIKILTSEFGLKFSQAIAKQKLESIYLEHPQYKHLIEEKDNSTKYPISILSAPKIIDEFCKDYTTEIVVNCKKFAESDIINQIQQIQMEEIVLLPNITEIEVVSFKYHKIFKKIIEKENILVEEHDLISHKTEKVSWHIFSKSGKLDDDIDKKNNEYEFKIAYDEKTQRSGKVLYSYFKTNIGLSFPAIVHGTFELTSNRNSLITDGLQGQRNKKLIELLSDFLIETALKIAKNGKVNYNPLKLVINTNMDYVLKEKFNLISLLLEKVKLLPIFPTINNEYISLKDHPYYLRQNFAKYLNPEKFNTLLQHCDDENIENFIKINCEIPDYDNETFISMINESANSYTLEQRCNIIKLFSERRYIESNKTLNLLLDFNNNSILDDRIVFSNSSNNNTYSDLPSWAKISFISSDMQNYLMSLFNVGDQRTLINNYLKNITKLREYNLSFLLSSLNSQSYNEHNKKLEIIKWLWNNFEKLRETNPDIESMPIDLICRNGKIIDKQKCYIGKEYGNYLCEELSSYFNYIADAKIYNFSNYSETMAKEFFEWLNVAKFPRFTYTEKIEDERIIDEYKNILAYYCGRYKEEMLYINIKAGWFDHFDEIITKSSLENLISWFILDYKLQNTLRETTENNNYESTVKGLFSKQRQERILNHYYNLPSYIRLFINNSAWFKNHKTSYCCFETMGINSVLIEPKYDLNKVKKILSDYNLHFDQSTQNKINEFFSLLGFKSKFEDLDPEIMYEVLLALPKDDPNLKNAQNIYFKIKTEMANKTLPTDSEAYINFCKNGMVPVKFKGKKQYISNHEAYYVGNKIYNDKILEDFPMLLLDARVGEQRVKELFNVQPLKNINLQITSQPTFSFLNENFRKDYLKLLPYIYLIRKNRRTKDKNDEFYKLKNNKINICDKVTYSYSLNGDVVEKELLNNEHVYIKKDKVAYIKLSSEFKNYAELKLDGHFADCVSDSIANILDVQDDKITFSQLFQCTEADRNRVVGRIVEDKGFDELSEIKKKFAIFNHKEEFWDLICEIKKFNNDNEKSLSTFYEKYKIPNSLINNINYDNLNDFNSLKNLIKLFSLLNINVNVYNEKASEYISLIPYYKAKLNELTQNYYKKYQYYLYLSLENDKNCVEKFVNQIQNYNDDDYVIDDSIYFNCEKAFEKKNNILIKKLSLIDEDIDSIINKKRTKYKTEIEDLESRLDLSELEITSYVIFDKINNFQQTPSENQNDETPEKIDNFEIIYKPDSEINKKVKLNKTFGQTKRKVHKKYSEKSHKTSIYHGKYAEQCVYKKLCEIYGENNVSWISGSSDDKNNLMDKDDSAGYDMFYFDKNNVKHLVEVKSKTSITDNSFELSENELQTAIKNKNLYEIYFVKIDKQKEKTIIEPKLLFNLDDDMIYKDNENYSIKPTKYKITIKK